MVVSYSLFCGVVKLEENADGLVGISQYNNPNPTGPKVCSPLIHR